MYRCVLESASGSTERFAGYKRNESAEESALSAYQSAQKTLDSNEIADIVLVYQDGEEKCATVKDGEKSYSLTDLLHNWACCSCSRSTQQEICRHHVLALLRVFSDVGMTEFSNQLLKFAGRKFGAAQHCRTGIGGMQPLVNKLAQLQDAAKALRLSAASQQLDATIVAANPVLAQAQALLAARKHLQHPSIMATEAVDAGTQAAATSTAAIMPPEQSASLRMTQALPPAHPECSQLQAGPPLTNMQDDAVLLELDSAECAPRVAATPTAVKGSSRATLTPSKRCVAEGAQTLKKAFSDGFEVLLDPNTASPLRRQLHALLRQSAMTV